MKLLTMPYAAQPTAPAVGAHPFARIGARGCGIVLNRWLFGFLVVILGVAIYGPVRHFVFLNFDDDRFIYENPWLYKGFTWESIRWAFSANLTQYSYFAEYWSPLTLLSRLADAQAFGMNPRAFHVTSAALHLVNACLLGAALWRLTGLWERSAFVALLFLVHPLNVEAVCWLSARKDLVSGAFFFGTLLAYAHYARQPNVPRYLILLAAFSCALMAKPMGVSTPLLLLVLDVWPLQRWADATGNGHKKLRLVLEKIPLLIFAGVAALFAVLSQRDVGALKSADGFSMLTRVYNALVAYVLYLRRAFWPGDLALFYPHRGAALPAWEAAGAAAILAAATFGALWLRRRAPYLLAGWLWFIVVLAPVIGIVQIGQQALADRYAYPSLIGILVAIVWGAVELLRGRRRAVLICATASVAALSLVSMRQVQTWRDSITVFTRATEVTANNTVAYMNLGAAYHAEGDLMAARQNYLRAVSILPSAPVLWLNLGNTEGEMGRDDAAIQDYWLSLQTEKSNPSYNKSVLSMARILLKREANGEAVAYLKSAIDLDPFAPEPYRLLAGLCAKQARWHEAAAVWSACLKQRPDDAQAREGLRTARERMQGK